MRRGVSRDTRHAIGIIMPWPGFIIGMPIIITGFRIIPGIGLIGIEGFIGMAFIMCVSPE